MYQLGVHFGILDWSFLPENINLCFSVFLLIFTHLPADSRSRKGWRKEIKPNGFLLSVRPSSSKTTVTMFNGSILREPIQKIWNIYKAFARCDIFPPFQRKSSLHHAIATVTTPCSCNCNNASGVLFACLYVFPTAPSTSVSYRRQTRQSGYAPV